MKTTAAALCVLLLSGCSWAWRTIGGAASSTVEATRFELEEGYARIEREYCISGTCGRVVTEYRNETLHPPDADPIECAIECIDADIDLDLSLLPDGYDAFCWATAQNAEQDACNDELERLARPK